MKRFLTITLNITVWLAILAYLVFAARHCRNEQQAERLKRTEIIVSDYDRLQIVSPETVRGWLAEAGIRIDGVSLEQVNTDSIISVIGRQPFVQQVQAYTEQSGTLHITLSQRQPVVRVSRGDGREFYISDDMWVLPTKTGTAQYVPVITGDFSIPFTEEWYGELCPPAESNPSIGSDYNTLPVKEKKMSQNYIFLVKLINFAIQMSKDPFWDAQIVQINVREDRNAPDWKEPDIELVPRAGNHLIVMGTLDDAEQKLAKLMLFYRNVLDYEGWDRHRLIDIRYDNQVICR